jgi:peptide/nickel transport system permease protein
MKLFEANSNIWSKFTIIRTDLLERFLDVLRRDLKAKIGVVLVSLVAMAAILAPEMAPYDPLAQDFAPFLAPGESQHLLGTDSYGRDLLSRLMYGARISLAIGVLSVSFGMILGVFTGIFAGYYGGWIDDTLMRAVDVVWAFPFLLLAVLLVALFGNGFWLVVVALGIAFIDDFARITRGEVLSIREEEYILSAKNIGMGNISIIREEVFPNIVAPIIVEFTILVARAMVAETTLSFLGLGVKPTTPTWGSILRGGRDFIGTAWWISLIPGLCIVVTVLGINLFGDALRDSFDVQEAGSQ